jgi:hypothetical protein
MKQRKTIGVELRPGMHGLSIASCAFVLAGLGAACSGTASGAAGASAPQFAYAGPDAWAIAGPLGGPFTNTSADFTLSNSGALPVAWAATSVPAFVQLDALAGIIPAGGATSVHAQLDTTTALTFPVGELADTLLFHNETAQQADVAIGCDLSVTEPVISTELLPLAEFDSAGPAGGQFLPSSTAYDLTDTGSAPLGWRTSVGDPWVFVSPPSGQLAPSATVALTIGIKESATAALATGLHLSHVDIVDSANSSTLHSRAVALNVTPGGSSEGWTVFTANSQTRKVYVSSSGGQDSNNGLSESSPKRTIAAGKELLRNGSPDWLLLKCGDTWTESIGKWGLSGRSATEPILIGSYGTGARPFLRTGISPGIITDWHTNPNYVAIVGLHMLPHLYDGSNANVKGIEWLRHTDSLLIENCFIERYTTNIVIQGTNESVPTSGTRHKSVRIRRNILVDSFNCNNSGSGGANTSQAIYAYGVDGLLIEENVMDHNGWIDGIPGSIPTWVRHNGYIANGNTGVVLRGNIIASSDGVMMRSGGLVEENLYLQNYNAILYGLGIEPEPAGVTGTIRRNVVLDGRDYGDGNGNPLPGGLCIDIGNVVNSTVEGNIFAHNTTGTGPRPIQIHDAHGAGSWRVIENTTFSNNIIYDWGGNLIDIQTAEGGQSQQPVNLQFTGNTLQGSGADGILVAHSVPASVPGVSAGENKFFSTRAASEWFRIGGRNQDLAQWKLQVRDTTSAARQVQFPDPNRTIASYGATIGKTPSLAAFLAEARLQSKANWRPAYTAAAVNAYIRAGFGM